MAMGVGGRHTGSLKHAGDYTVGPQTENPFQMPQLKIGCCSEMDDDSGNAGKVRRTCNLISVVSGRGMA